MSQKKIKICVVPVQSLQVVGLFSFRGYFASWLVAAPHARCLQEYMYIHIICVYFQTGHKIFHVCSYFIYIANNQYLGQIICTDRKVKRKCMQALNIIPAMNFCAATDTSRVLRSRRHQDKDAHVCVRDTRVSAHIRRNKRARTHTYMIGRMDTHAHSRATR